MVTQTRVERGAGPERPKGVERAQLSPELQTRKTIEGFFSKSGKVLLVFLAAMILVILAAYGRQLFEILTGNGMRP